MTKKQTNYTIFASFFAMLTLAITETIRGVIIPSFKSDFGVTDTHMGIFLSITTFAYVGAIYFAGRLVRKLGQKRTVLIGLSVAGLGFLGTAFAATYTHLVIGYFILTLGISCVVMSLNTIVPLLQVSYLAVVMNLLHFFYGFGATITQRVAGYMITAGVSWRHIFIGFFLMYALAIILYAFVKQPPRIETEKHHDKIHSYEVPLVIFFCLSLGFYITAEIQTANWLLNYLKEMYAYTESHASVYTALFYAFLAFGRLIGGYILEKIGYLRGTMLTLIGAFILYSIGLSGEKTLMLISLSGFFFAVVYPTTVLVVQKFFVENASTALSIITMAASIVSMIFGGLIGVLNDLIGVKLAFLVMPASILLSLIFMIAIRLNIKHVERIRGELL